ncbi:MAG: hypothetical protein NTZ85_12100 [Bacteroidia bacterium]|jgi:hypothetical protein|nr:hypothetical protein [Bacteroidia bacterium]
MELFENTRLKIGNSILLKRIANIRRKIFYSNIGQIKKIGVVWDTSKTQDFSSLSKFYQKMHERNIDVKILGFYPGKELPNQYTAIRYLSCIRRKEINFFYIPVSTETDVFINTKFDVLIDINFDKSFPLFYITSMSSASFKVGLFDLQSGESTFDLMIELKKPVSIENYLEQVIHYLEMIKSGSSDLVYKQ